MARKYSDDIEESTKALLAKLTDTETESQEYRDTMYNLGLAFGRKILKHLGQKQTVSLATTAEDADFLGRGIIEVLEQHGNKVLLTVFWNKRFKPFAENGLSVAPILREFHDLGYKEAKFLVVIKSIIANSCVVRTNLTRLIEETNPDNIFVVAPVILKDAPAKLEVEFEKDISSKFKYFFFAEDDQKSAEGMVIPGIGGDVYKRLGFKNQDEKNKITPKIVKARRKLTTAY